jgi:hypothetical protein
MEKRRAREVSRRYSFKKNIAIKLYGKQWNKVASYIGTRTNTQVRSHAQKHFLKFLRKKYSAQSPKHKQNEPTNEIPNNKTRMQMLRNSVSAIMTQITSVRELNTPKEKEQLLESLRASCLCVNNELQVIMAQIMFGMKCI